MKRILLLLTVVALMAVMLSMAVAPAFAQGPPDPVIENVCDLAAVHHPEHFPPFCVE